MKRKVLFAVFPVLLIVCGVFIYRDYQLKNKLIKDKKIIYNTQLARWEEVNEIKDPIDADRETILKKDNNQNGLHNETIMRAYFDSYSENEQELSVKYLLALTQGVYKVAKLKLSPNQTIYCAPEIYIDPNNGQAHDLKKLIFPVETGAKLWIPTEKLINFDDFLSKSSQETFLYIQLNDNFDPQKTNYVQKLIVVGLCE